VRRLTFTSDATSQLSSKPPDNGAHNDCTDHDRTDHDRTDHDRTHHGVVHPDGIDRDNPRYHRTNVNNTLDDRPPYSNHAAASLPSIHRRLLWRAARHVPPQ
jgi:hypothetical protein